ncbi:hypothetical protein Ac2012v2_000371 [Leucoagaricus gongylophorus]
MPPMTFQGIVTKVGFMDRTATVTVSRFVVHKLTDKQIERKKKYLVHDKNNELRQDDLILIRSCPPISARKHFTLERVLRSPFAERKLARMHHVQEVKAAPASISST